jgi:hypothetical protein
MKNLFRLLSLSLLAALPLFAQDEPKPSIIKISNEITAKDVIELDNAKEENIATLKQSDVAVKDESEDEEAE